MQTGLSSNITCTHSGADEGSNLLGYDVSIGKGLPAFRRTSLPPSSGPKMHKKSGLLEL